MRKPPCAVCRSRRWRRTDEGGWVCDAGHRLEHYVEEVDEMRFDGPMRQVRLRKMAARRPGERRRFAFGETLDVAACECFQHVLWMQARAMVERLGFDARVEQVMRELWLVYAVEELDVQWPLLDGNGEPSHVVDGDRAGETGQSAARRARGEDAAAEEDMNGTNDETTSSDVDDTLSTLPRTRRTKRGVPQGLDLEYTLAFCHLASLYLRYPFVLADFWRWAVTGQLPFLYVKQKLPPALVQCLRGSNIQDLRTVPLPHTLYQHSNYLVHRLATRGAFLPQLNLTGALRRYQQWLCVDDAIATTALRLASHASLTLQYPTKRHAFAPEPHMPCVALMSAMIVAVKLHHDVAADEDASRDEWLSQAESKRDDMLRGCPAMFVSDLDVHDGRDLSAYLEMCSTAFFPNYRSREETSEFAEFFRNVPSPPATHSINVIDFPPQASSSCNAKGKSIVTRDPREQPPSNYIIYPKKATRFHEAYARLLHICTQWLRVDAVVLHEAVDALERRCFAQS